MSANESIKFKAQESDAAGGGGVRTGRERRASGWKAADGFKSNAKKWKSRAQPGRAADTPLQRAANACERARCGHSAAATAQCAFAVGRSRRDHSARLCTRPPLPRSKVPSPGMPPLHQLTLPVFHVCQLAALLRTHLLARERRVQLYSSRCGCELQRSTATHRDLAHRSRPNPLSAAQPHAFIFV